MAGDRYGATGERERHQAHIVQTMVRMCARLCTASVDPTPQTPENDEADHQTVQARLASTGSRCLDFPGPLSTSIVVTCRAAKSV